MQIEKLIEDNSLKLTTARKELLEILLCATKPLCYEDVKESINMDKATFYRNVSKFEESSMISSFESNDKKRYFEIKDSPHAHFICNNCNSVECIKEQIDVKLEGYKISDMIFKGICKKCNI